jgi:hypothetical protein
VPGVWVLAPEVGYLWTPPYWGWSSGLYLFHAGYWGPHIGFYGGVNYGFGYFGHGYEGGAWVGGHFSYNRVYNNINVATIHNTYVHNVTVVNTGNRVAFNGGAGGVQARPAAAELAAARETHVQPTALQASHQAAAAQDRAQLASVNGGKPGLAAARTPEAYHNVAMQHAATRPISESDRTAARPQGMQRPAGQTSAPVRPQGQPQSRPAAPAQARPQSQPRPSQPAPQSHTQPAPSHSSPPPQPHPSHS